MRNKIYDFNFGISVKTRRSAVAEEPRDVAYHLHTIRYEMLL